MNNKIKHNICCYEKKFLIMLGMINYKGIIYIYIYSVFHVFCVLFSFLAIIHLVQNNNTLK